MVDKNKKILENTLETEKKESDTKNITKTDDLKEDKKDKKTSNDIFVFLILLMVIIIAVFFFFKKDKILNIFKFKNTENQNKQEEIYKNIKADRDFYNKTIQKLTENIAKLEREIEFNNEYIKNLQTKLTQIESQLTNININPQRTELIKTAINIQTEILNNLSYSEELSSLKILSKDNPTILEKANILEVYKNNYPSDETILKNFENEFIKFNKENNILKNSNNKFSNFLSNFIVIRKIKNIENNTSNSFSLNLEKAIQTKNYKLSLEILENNQEYVKFFPKTLENLKTIVLLNNTTEEIINYLINN